MNKRDVVEWSKHLGVKGAVAQLVEGLKVVKRNCVECQAKECNDCEFQMELDCILRGGECFAGEGTAGDGKSLENISEGGRGVSIRSLNTDVDIKELEKVKEKVLEVEGVEFPAPVLTDDMEVKREDIENDISGDLISVPEEILEKERKEKEKEKEDKKPVKKKKSKKKGSKKKRGGKSVRKKGSGK